jgi:Tol biopolymer transport system component
MGMAGSRLGSAARLSLVALVVSFALAPTAAHAAFPGANGKIAFDTTRDGNSEIYSMNPDGTSQTRLTSNGARDVYPAWSPDGSKIAFESTRDDSNPTGCPGCDRNIYTMDADGTNVMRLTSDPAGDGGPTWSPDGSKIAFSSNRAVDTATGRHVSEIYTMNSDGSAQTRLTFSPSCTSIDPTRCPQSGFPSWSPDGARIVFGSGFGPSCDDEGSCVSSADIFAINSDGSGLTNLTNLPGSVNNQPDWSPDGVKIAYTAAHISYPDIAIMNGDGSDRIFVTNSSSYPGAFNPVWSPDGSKISFDGCRSGACGIYVVNADGTGETRLNGSPTDADPSWQPSYHHPQSASQLRVSLVPTFKQCGTGANPSNAKHAPSLATNSCNPPQPGSVLAAVGTTSQSSAQMTVVPGDTDATNGNQANISITASLTDIQTVAGGDYNPNASGADLTAVTRLRFTDMANGNAGLPATATEYDFKVPIDCSSTGNPKVGSTCTANTTANSLIPGLIQEQELAVVQAFRVRIDDSGANGVRGDADDRIFA